MRYLITNIGEEPFMTDMFDLNNFFVDGMVIYDLIKLEYTNDGYRWDSIDMDSW